MENKVFLSFIIAIFLCLGTSQKTMGMQSLEQKQRQLGFPIKHKEILTQSEKEEIESIRSDIRRFVYLFDTQKNSLTKHERLGIVTSINKAYRELHNHSQISSEQLKCMQKMSITWATNISTIPDEDYSKKLYDLKKISSKILS